MTRTKGDVIVEEIKIGDILYEYDYGIGIKSIVKTLPKLNEEGNWVWKNEIVSTGKEINYLVNPEYPHYAPNLYTTPTYTVNTLIE